MHKGFIEHWKMRSFSLTCQMTVLSSVLGGPQVWGLGCFFWFHDTVCKNSKITAIAPESNRMTFMNVICM